jgi:hypothetical protein
MPLYGRGMVATGAIGASYIDAAWPNEIDAGSTRIRKIPPVDERVRPLLLIGLDGPAAPIRNT